MKVRTIMEIAIIIFLVLPLLAAAIQPSAPTTIDNTGNESPDPTAGSMLNTSGGQISFVNIQATTQNYRWKGYVGNVSGKYSLLDSSLDSLFDWDLTTITGEIYATRNNTALSWDSIICADESIIGTEQEQLNISTNNIDSINHTFNETTHKAFYAGLNKMDANQCPSTYLNVNNTRQSKFFQQVLLSDGSNLIYASLLENSTYGFNNQTYDFQIILAENALEGQQESTAYYFYVELI